ncbi:hypothetical protein GCM10010103_42340 [Streptomyces paradoxus]
MVFGLGHGFSFPEPERFEAGHGRDHDESWGVGPCGAAEGDGPPVRRYGRPRLSHQGFSFSLLQRLTPSGPTLILPGARPP